MPSARASRQVPKSESRTSAKPSTRTRNKSTVAQLPTHHVPELDDPYKLVPTEDPNVFLNHNGDRVDAQGLKLNVVHNPALSGLVANSPADLLRQVAMNAAIPLGVRIDAAKAAAPYFDRRQPTEVETTNKTRPAFDTAALLKLPKAERLEMLRLLSKVGVDVTLPSSADKKT